MLSMDCGASGRGQGAQRRLPRESRWEGMRGKWGGGGVRKIFGVYFEAGTSRCLADGLEVGYKRESHHRE